MWSVCQTRRKIYIGPDVCKILIPQLLHSSDWKANSSEEKREQQQQQQQHERKAETHLQNTHTLLFFLRRWGGGFLGFAWALLAIVPMFQSGDTNAHFKMRSSLVSSVLSLSHWFPPLSPEDDTNCKHRLSLSLSPPTKRFLLLALPLPLLPLYLFTTELPALHLFLLLLPGLCIIEECELFFAPPSSLHVVILISLFLIPYQSFTHKPVCLHSARASRLYS